MAIIDSTDQDNRLDLVTKKIDLVILQLRSITDQLREIHDAIDEGDPICRRSSAPRSDQER